MFLSDINANEFHVNVEFTAVNEKMGQYPIKITLGAVTLLFHYSLSMELLQHLSQDDIINTVYVSAVQVISHFKIISVM